MSLLLEMLSTTIFLLLAFLPGLLLALLLFPLDEFGWQLGVGVGLSLVILGTIALFLSLIPFGNGITFLSLVVTLISLNSLFTVMLWRWRWKIIKKLFQFAPENTRVNIAIAIIFLPFLVVIPFLLQIKRESFSEFYIVDSYPTPWPWQRHVALTEPISVTVVVVSHELQANHFSIKLLTNEMVIQTFNLGTIEAGKTLEQLVYIPPRTQSAQQFALRLYKDEITKPYRLLDFWLKATPTTPTNTIIPLLSTPKPFATYPPTISSTTTATPTPIDTSTPTPQLSATYTISPTATPKPTFIYIPTPSTPILVKLLPTTTTSAPPIHGLFLMSQGITVSQEGRVLYSPYVIPSNTELAFSFRLIGSGVEPKLVGIGVPGGLFRSELGPYQIDSNGKSFQNLKLFFPQAGTFTLFVQIQAQSGEWRILEGESGEPQEGINIVVE